MPLLDERFAAAAPTSMPGGEFDWEGMGVEELRARIAPSDDPNAWTAEDALFVPLRDPKGS